MRRGGRARRGSRRRCPPSATRGRAAKTRLPDDMIDTGGTVAEGAAALKRLGAGKIYAFASHALLSGPAAERLRAAPVDEVAVTNTIHIPDERRFEKLQVLSIADLMAKAIGYEHSNQSVSSLFD